MINGYAALEAKAALEAFSYDEGELGAFDVDIDISHCGVCPSDLHLVDADWGPMSQYPMIPGHEIIGTVKAVGSNVDKSMIDKRVGVGWLRGSCLNCEWCISGQEVLCASAIPTCIGHYGGFAERIVVDSRFTYIIPDGLTSETTAPLLCAGHTIYSPLMRYASSQSRVGIIGIGGLGHLAVQFANKMGCEVIAFSSSDAKQDEAQELGAHHYVNGSDDDALKKAQESCDVILATAPANLDWNKYLSILRRGGTLCFVGVPSAPINAHIGLLLQNKQIAGSSTGGRIDMRNMLAFAARHKIEAWTEKLPMDSVNTALSRLRENDVRYRFVLEA